MQEHFAGEKEALQTNLIKMASLVDDQAERAIKALETGDIELCKGIKARDLEIDAYDNLIQTAGSTPHFLEIDNLQQYCQNLKIQKRKQSWSMRMQ